jgi:hypothetical protein
MIGSLFLWAHTNTFLKNSILAEGTIIDIAVSTSRDSDNHIRTSRFPIVRFLDQEGHTLEFQSSTSSTNSITIGRQVNVRYLPGQSGDAKMADSFSDIWGPTLFCVLAGVFGLILGGPFFWLGIRDELNEKRALSYSMEITVPIKSVFQNTSLTVNGRSPFRIEAHWLNPDTQKIHILKSKNLWFDPSEFLQDTITVKMDPRNPKKYWMDVSFIPQVA